MKDWSQLPNPAEQFEILNDGTMVPVKYKPVAGNEAAPTDEMVKVWKYGMGQMPILAAAMTGEIKEIAAVTKRTEEWVATLTDDSFELLIEEGRRLNFTQFSRYWKRQAALLKAIGQGEAMEAAVEKALAKVMG